jgi:hypothetical protein
MFEGRTRATGHLRRISFEQGRPIEREPKLGELHQRIRDVRQAPTAFSSNPPWIRSHLNRPRLQLSRDRAIQSVYQLPTEFNQAVIGTKLAHCEITNHYSVELAAPARPALLDAK